MATVAVRLGDELAKAKRAGTENRTRHAVARPVLDADFEFATRPLDFDLIRWLYGYTRPHAAKRNTLLALVTVRSIQLPLLAWATGEIVNGPIANGLSSALVWPVLTFFGLTAITQLTLHFRQRLALELGEA